MTRRTVALVGVAVVTAVAVALTAIPGFAGLDQASLGVVIVVVATALALVLLWYGLDW